MRRCFFAKESCGLSKRKHTDVPFTSRKTVESYCYSYDNVPYDLLRLNKAFSSWVRTYIHCAESYRHQHRLPNVETQRKQRRGDGPPGDVDAFSNP